MRTWFLVMTVFVVIPSPAKTNPSIGSQGLINLATIYLSLGEQAWNTQSWDFICL
jgi:hypothetical protein